MLLSVMKSAQPNYLQWFKVVFVMGLHFLFSAYRAWGPCEPASDYSLMDGVMGLQLLWVPLAIQGGISALGLYSLFGSLPLQDLFLLALLVAWGIPSLEVHLSVVFLVTWLAVGGLLDNLMRRLHLHANRALFHCNHIPILIGMSSQCNREMTA